MCDYRRGTDRGGRERKGIMCTEMSTCERKCPGAAERDSAGSVTSSWGSLFQKKEFMLEEDKRISGISDTNISLST